MKEKNSLVRIVRHIIKCTSDIDGCRKQADYYFANKPMCHACVVDILLSELSASKAQIEHLERELGGTDNRQK